MSPANLEQPFAPSCCEGGVCNDSFYLASVELQRQQDDKINKLQLKLNTITNTLIPYGEEFLKQQKENEPIYCKPLEYLTATLFIDSGAWFEGESGDGFINYSWRGQPIKRK